MTLQFSVIRFVPDPARQEFVNIGAVVGDPEADEWELRLVSNLTRAKALDDRGVFDKALGFAATLEDNIAALGELTPPVAAMSVELLERLAGEMQNIVQVTAPAPLMAESTEAGLDLLFDQVVLDAARRTHPYAKKHSGVAAVRRGYNEVGIESAVRQRTPVSSGVFDAVFDFAVHNGRAVQLVQCWSFQLPDQGALAEQVKAWSFVVNHIRDQGGRLPHADGSVDVPSDLEIYSVVIPPTADGSGDAFEEACVAFAENGVEVARSDDTAQLGARAAALLSA